jgi:SET domain-containing protein
MSKVEKPYVIKRTGTGLGLITLKPISKGTRIIEYFGPLVPNEEVEKRTGKYFFELNDKFSVDGSPRDNIARYINHSCRPNAEAIISRNERIWIWAKRDIKAGEELTYNYGKDYFDNVIKPMGCRCVRCQERSK